jgi:poly [ADP-ribose] polymerase
MDSIELNDEQPSKRARLDTEFRPHKSTGTMQQRGALASNASATVKTVDGVACVVDPMLSNSEQYTIVVDDGEPLAAFLNQVESTTNTNKFYRLELLERDGVFHVWTRWGRNGDANRFSNALKVCETKESALKLFHSTFRSKTGCTWVDREKATPGRKGKYAFVKQVVTDASEKPPTQPTPTALSVHDSEAADADTFGFLSYVLDGAARKFELDALGVDVAGARCTRLAPEQLAQAHGVLEELSKMLSGSETNCEVTVDVDQVRALSDRFYALVPTKTGRSVPPPIDSAEMLAAKLDVLEALSAPEDVAIEDPGAAARAFVRSSGLTIQPLATESLTFKALSEYVSSTAVHYGLVLKKAFELSDGPATVVEGSSRRLLFHGSRRCNLASILTSGLKLRNKAVRTGAMLGSGIYTGCNSTKSFNYGFGSNILFACEVSLPGPLYEPKAADPDAEQTCRDNGFHGVHARGKRTVTGWAPFAGDANVKIPSSFGDGPQDSALLWDEFVTFHENRIGIRYVLVIERVEKA